MIQNTNKTNCNCDTNCACDHITAKPAENATLGYGFYSNVLRKPFENLAELKRAEEVYFAEQKAKEDKANQKKTDAKKVEDTFKALNAARKEYKENLTQLTKEYSEELTNLKKAFDFGKKDISNKLAKAEDAYAKALKEFTASHPEGYHVTLRDGDFETTISGSSKVSSNDGTSKEAPKSNNLFDIFDILFNF
jgi:septal ring factor EnvC (AmiA/AmiB activator)